MSSINYFHYVCVWLRIHIHHMDHFHLHLMAQAAQYQALRRLKALMTDAQLMVIGSLQI
jgi:hypothetical protein